jgi:hypothetical protein
VQAIDGDKSSLSLISTKGTKAILLPGRLDPSFPELKASAIQGLQVAMPNNGTLLNFMLPGRLEDQQYSYIKKLQPVVSEYPQWFLL